MRTRWVGLGKMTVLGTLISHNITVLPSQAPAQLLRWPGRTPQACSELMASNDAISHDTTFHHYDILLIVS